MARTHPQIESDPFSPAEEENNSNAFQLEKDLIRSQEKIKQERIDVARKTMWGVGGLLAVVLLMLLGFGSKAVVTELNLSHLLALIISGLFSVATLILGFIAGSSIDK